MNILKEFILMARIAYYTLAMSQLCASHRDYPAIVIHVSYLREQLAAIRSGYAKA